jgi:type IV secretion system protein VirB11
MKTLEAGGAKDGNSSQEGVYLRTFLRPLEPFLHDESITEILINRPGEVWTEHEGRAGMQVHHIDELDEGHLSRLAAQIARQAFQGINRENPLLSASLPGGERIQIIAPPAAPHWTMAIRRHRQKFMSLEDYDRGPLKKKPLAEVQKLKKMAEERPVTFLQEAVLQKKTILVSGGTSSGKTTFLNALLHTVPEHERIITVEDTAEIKTHHQNRAALMAVKGEMGESRVTVDDLLQASLRLRPDRIIVGEIRGHEANTFLRAINTGHPGSFTTVHANTARGALEQIALMVLQSGTQLSRQETLHYAATLIDVVVQLGRVDGERQITDIWLPLADKDLA